MKKRRLPHCVRNDDMDTLTVIATTALDVPSVERAMDGKNVRLASAAIFPVYAITRF